MAGFARAGRFWLAAGVLLADQLAKAAVLARIPEHASREVLRGCFNLVHIRNRGIAFGLLSDVSASWLNAALMVFSFAAIVFLGWLLVTGRAGYRLGRVGLALMLGGAAGNLVDRLVRGSVIDFIDLYAGDFHWPAFNLADSAITVGAVLVAVELFLRREPERSAP
ncbi:MAG: signal peptidase II [Acidobacteriia bacterium]|jgi:signal peptidase II|nr:signal peptidase II [Terriglobia bacterium]